MILFEKFKLMIGRKLLFIEHTTDTFLVNQNFEKASKLIFKINFFSENFSSQSNHDF